MGYRMTATSYTISTPSRCLEVVCPAPVAGQRAGCSPGPRPQASPGESAARSPPAAGHVASRGRRSAMMAIESTPRSCLAQGPGRGTTAAVARQSGRGLSALYQPPGPALTVTHWHGHTGSRRAPPARGPLGHRNSVRVSLSLSGRAANVQV